MGAGRPRTGRRLGHAYLHRKEGDFGNAAYWYQRAGRRPPADAADLRAEWEQIVRELLPAATATRPG